MCLPLGSCRNTVAPHGPAFCPPTFPARQEPPISPTASLGFLEPRRVPATLLAPGAPLEAWAPLGTAGRVGGTAVPLAGGRGQHQCLPNTLFPLS